MKPLLFFDLDGVLVDFDGEYTRLTGKTWEHRQTESTEEKWTKLEPFPFFFSEMPWFPGSVRMYHYALNIKQVEVGILSAASHHVPSSSIQKWEWCQREVPEVSEANRIIVGRKRDKANYAKDNFLVDDMQVNIDQWQEAGGIGFLFKDAESTIQDLFNHFSAK